MKKYVLIAIGAIIALYAIIKSSGHLINIQNLSGYHKGYLLGQGILLLIGCILIGVGFRSK